MSLGKEYAIEAECEVDLMRAKIAEEARSMVWTTRDGRHIRITDMTDQHLVNTLRMLERNNIMDIYLPWIAKFQAECKKRNLNIQFQEIIF